MAFSGILGVLAGELWNRWFPINKNLWTSSFVLFTGGFCLLFLSLLFWMTEIKQWRGKWTMPILVFGMNAIAGFVADSLIYGPGYTFTVMAANGAKMNWHEAAQAHLETTRFEYCQCFFGLFARRGPDLLDYALVFVAEKDLLKSVRLDDSRPLGNAEIGADWR
jgi:predicted acyltransferase